MHEVARSKLQAARRAAGHSLRDLASRTGISASQLSQIEQGKSDPSVSSLFSLVSELGLSLDELLDIEGAEPGNNESNGSGPAAESRAASTPSPVIGPAERPVLEMNSGVRWEQLTREQHPHADTLLVTYHPGGRSSSDGKMMTHSGTEVAYIISGSLTLKLAFDTYVLRQGDSMAFDSSTPHMFDNPNTEPAVGVWFITKYDHHGAGGMQESLSTKGAPESSGLSDFHRALYSRSI